MIAGNLIWIMGNNETIVFYQKKLKPIDKQIDYYIIN